jgi:hypothetical protein
MNVVVVAIAGGVFACWLLSTFLFRVTGTWERELTPSERESGVKPERMTLGQLGPLITGRRDVAGGHIELSGLLIGRTLRLTRRDHGVKALQALGFPEPIALKLDGEVTARLELQLRGGVLPLFLEGSFTPQKVEFTHQPPKITRSYFLEAQPRRYRKLDGVAVEAESAT